VPHRSFVLEITPAAFRPKPFVARGVRVTRATAVQHARCRALWRHVGQGFWTARSRWTATRWRQHLRDETVSFWLATLGDHDIGFFELIVQRRAIKIEGLGLLPDWRHRGLGAGLLSAATRHAFALGAGRVRLHTATDDHPNALPNYRARGYRVSQERPLRHPMPSPAPADRPQRSHTRHRPGHGVSRGRR
jgi:ribosomal protein S18 acetylase RimI-like enzyme